MNSAGFDDDLEFTDEVDGLEHQFFSQPRLVYHDLDWGPVTPGPRGSRRAMHAVLGMVVLAFVALVAFVVYVNLIMLVPVPIGTQGPLLPPSAASAR